MNHMLPSLCCFTVFIICLCYGKADKNIHTIYNIKPDHLYCNQELYNGESAYYSVTNLKIKTNYEIRISYPAVRPTKFIIKDLNTTMPTGRKLLNIEKMDFQTSHNIKKSFQVTAFSTGFPVKTSFLDSPVVYDIIVEQLYFGLSIHVWKLVLIGLITLCVALKFCYLLFMSNVRANDQKFE